MYACSKIWNYYLNERAFLFDDIIYFMILMILRTMLRDSKYPENQLIDFENTVLFAKKCRKRAYISSRNTRNIWTGLNSRKFVCKRITRLNVHLKLSTQEATGTFKINVKTWVIMKDSVTLTTTKLYTLSEVWVIREKAVHVNLTCNRIFE